MTDTYSEKVSVNMNSAVLSEIDLLVDGGYYSNRSDFINQAVREALQRNASTVERVATSKKPAEKQEKSWFLGVMGFTKKEIEQLHAEGERFAITGYGVLIIPDDCPEDKLFEVVEAIHVRGKVKCTDSVREHYGL